MALFVCPPSSVWQDAGLGDEVDVEGGGVSRRWVNRKGFP